MGSTAVPLSPLGITRAFLGPALGGLLFGYDIGATSFVLRQISSSARQGVDWGDDVGDSALLQGTIAAAGVAGALLGSIVVFKVADMLGRRRELLVGAVLYGIGGAVEMLSGVNQGASAGEGISVLIMGRVIYGTAIGFAMHGAPAYIAEMSPPEIRGLLVSLKEAMIVIGILLGYAVGAILFVYEGAWIYTYGVSVPIAVIMFMIVFGLPPSPRWLLLKGRVNAAKAAAGFILRNPEDAADVVADMQGQLAEAEAEASLSRASTHSASVEYTRQPQHSSKEGDFTGGPAPKLSDPQFRAALIAGIGLVVLQQITGQPSVLYFASQIFNKAGVDDVATVGVAGFKVLMTFATVFTVDKLGRKTLLYAGISLMLLALTVMCIAFSIIGDGGDDDDGDDDSTSLGSGRILVLVAMFIYIGGYQVGFGPISWLMISEIFPLNVRGKAVSVAVQQNFLWNLVVTFAFPIALDAIGGAATFGVFAIISLCSLAFVLFYVPETKGLTLEQIEALLNKGVARGTASSDAFLGNGADAHANLLANDSLENGNGAGQDHM